MSRRGRDKVKEKGKGAAKRVGKTAGPPPSVPVVTDAEREAWSRVDAGEQCFYCEGDAYRVVSHHGRLVPACFADHGNFA